MSNYNAVCISVVPQTKKWPSLICGVEMADHDNIMWISKSGITSDLSVSQIIMDTPTALFFKEKHTETISAHLFIFRDRESRRSLLPRK